MSLSRRLLMMNMLLILALISIAAIPYWGIRNLNRKLDIVAQEFMVDLVLSAQNAIDQARAILGNSARDPTATRDVLQLAIKTVDTLRHNSDRSGSLLQRKLAQGSYRELESLLGQLDQPVNKSLRLKLLEGTDHIDRNLSIMADQVYRAVTEARRDAASQTKRVILLLTVLAPAIGLGGLFVAIWQYHSVMDPLRRLQRGVRSIGQGDLSQRVEQKGDREFVELAGEFNRMAGQLAELYGNLEAKVQTTSRELVRSERLASVGFLAAGVAHEINNPLNIISGYAELLLKELQRPGEHDQTELRQPLSIIRDESFRCKQITGQLLSLARLDPEARTAVFVADLSKEVASIVNGLSKYGDRQLHIEFQDPGRLCVKANPTELKQVVLNLVVNAMEATTPGSGIVRIGGHRHNSWVELAVEDNGCGMTPHTLERVFEPFYSERRGRGAAGTGLGLSVTQAIVVSYGGSIRAYSDGPGRGSRFVVRLPETEHAAPLAAAGAADGQQPA